MWGILDRNEHKLSWRGKTKFKKQSDRQYRATFCPAQSRDVRRRRGADIKRSFLWHEGRFLLNITAVCCRCFASTLVSFSLLLNARLCSGEYTLCVSTSCPGVCRSLHVCRAKNQQRTSALNRLLMQCKANVFEVLLICFLFVSKTKKYCSFKYCALHRIFCHKLVNIYIFFSIFRHILSYIQDNKMLLFFFFFFLKKSLRMYVDSLCLCDTECLRQHCKAKTISLEMKTNIEPSEMNSDCECFSLHRSDGEDSEGGSKAGSFKRGTCHFRWSFSIWFKAVCFLLWGCWTLAEGSRRSARWTFCHWTTHNNILGVKLSRSHTYIKGNASTPSANVLYTR